MIPFLLTTAAIALSVPGIVLAVRALPWVARKVDAGVKPWACDVCSCFWVTGALALAVAGFSEAWILVLSAGPGYTLSLFLLSKLEQPTTLPPPPE